MINTSKEFTDNVYAPVRTCKGRIVFKIVDTEARDDSTFTASDSAGLSRIDQIINDNRKLSNKYATFENNYFKLDGSYKIPPKTSDTTTSEIGWWSNSISGANNAFANNPTLQIDFSEVHSSVGISLTFDPNDYPIDFDVVFYNASYNEIYSESVMANTDANYVLINGVTDYKRILLTFKKTSNPYRRIRLIEIDFGIINTYEDENLINMNIIEEISPTSNEVPINQLRFAIDNSDKSFNISTPNGFYRYLQERQEVLAELGVEINNTDTEYISVGKYYLKEWKSDEGTLTASFTAMDIFAYLDTIDSPINISGTLYQLAVGILSNAGISDYSIDTALQSYNTQGFTEQINSRTALQMIGMAAKSIIYQDRYGNVIIKQLESIGTNATYLTYCGDSELYCGTFYPLVDSEYTKKTIDLDNMYTTPQIKLDSAVKYIVVVSNANEVKTNHTFENTYISKGITLKLDNILINSLSHAQDVAQWLINQYNERAIYDINWRQNPSLECGDVVIVEDGFSTKKQTRITKQEFEYSGYLKGKTQTKGGV